MAVAGVSAADDSIGQNSAIAVSYDLCQSISARNLIGPACSGWRPLSPFQPPPSNSTRHSDHFSAVRHRWTAQLQAGEHPVTGVLFILWQPHVATGIAGQNAKDAQVNSQPVSESSFVKGLDRCQIIWQWTSDVRSTPSLDDIFSEYPTEVRVQSQSHQERAKAIQSLSKWRAV